MKELWTWIFGHGQWIYDDQATENWMHVLHGHLVYVMFMDSTFPFRSEFGSFDEDEKRHEGILWA